MKCQYAENISHGEALGVGQDAILTLKGNLGGVHLENYEWSHVASDAGWKKKKLWYFLGAISGFMLGCAAAIAFQLR